MFLSSALVTVINCHAAAITSDPIIRIGPLSVSADVPVDSCGIVVALRGVKHAHPCISTIGGGFVGCFIAKQVSHKTGLCKLPGRSLQSEMTVNLLPSSERKLKKT